MEISYSELRCKEVVNLNSGVKMGKIIDMIIDANGKNVLGVVVNDYKAPSTGKFYGGYKKYYYYNSYGYGYGSTNPEETDVEDEPEKNE